MYLIDRLSYSGSLKNVHPMEKMFFSLGALVLSIITGNPFIMSGSLFLMSFLIVYAAGVKFLDYIKLLSIPLIFILAGVMTIVVEVNSGTGVYIWRGEIAGVIISVSMESAVSGGIILLRSFTSVSCFYFFILTTPVTEVEYILRKMKLPALFIEIFMMTYRFIFVIAEMAGMIVISQRSRSGYISLRNRINSISLLASSVFVKSYFFSRASYNAMLSRGCDAGINVIDDSYRYSAINISFVVLFNACFIILILRFG